MNLNNGHVSPINLFCTKTSDIVIVINYNWPSFIADILLNKGKNRYIHVRYLPLKQLFTCIK